MLNIYKKYIGNIPQIIKDIPQHLTKNIPQPNRLVVTDSYYTYYHSLRYRLFL